MIAFEDLQVGDRIVTQAPLTDNAVRRWKYASECAPFSGVLPADTSFTIYEISAKPGSQFVRMAWSRNDLAIRLQASGAELERFFDFTRKSRPKNNFHCFDGVGFSYWFDLARGLRPKRELVRRMDGASWDLETDSDGLALQSGGMLSPKIAKLLPGYYYRFYSTIKHNRFILDKEKSENGMSGNWWIDYDSLKEIEVFAERHDYSLARAASICMIIPKEWHDCGYLGCGVLRNEMKAFVGKGAPAAGLSSFGNANGDHSAGSLMMSPASVNVKQFLAPGSPAEIASAFGALWSKPVSKAGVQIP